MMYRNLDSSDCKSTHCRRVWRRNVRNGISILSCLAVAMVAVHPVSFASASDAGQVTSSDIKGANVASIMASSAGLSSSNSVQSSAESANISATTAQADVTSADKQPATGTVDEVQPITQYVVKDGDNAASIAAANEVSDQTVRWANGLRDDNVTPGTVINIPAVDGVVYTMKEGDTLQSVADKYHSTVDAISTVNNLTTASVPVGTTIVLPDGVLPEEERPEYVAPTPQTTSNGLHYTDDNNVLATNSRAGRVKTTKGNSYAYGYCTWYAFNRRVQLGLPVSSGWGNANTWDTGAARSGYVVNTTPSAGAIFQTKAGYYGHVGVVERVNSDGSIYVSEMNFKGWNVKSYRTITSLSGYKFIH